MRRLFLGTSLPILISFVNYVPIAKKRNENLQKWQIGSIARGGGWYRSPSRFRPPSKRHIGALARLGWLPAFRTVRRFNRSGRSASEPFNSELAAEDMDRSAFRC